MLIQALFTICARCWDVSDQKYLVQKLFLLRGGRVLKAETMSMSGDRFTYWFETFQCKPLTPDERHFADRDEADFLHEEGQLKHNLAVQLDDMKEWGTNSNVNQCLKIGLSASVQDLRYSPPARVVRGCSQGLQHRHYRLRHQHS